MYVYSDYYFLIQTWRFIIVHNFVWKSALYKFLLFTILNQFDVLSLWKTFQFSIVNNKLCTWIL